MREFGLSYRETMELPFPALFSLNKQIDRLRAENDRRLLKVLITGHRGDEEAITSLQKYLDVEQGTVVVEKPVFDREGLHSLKELGRVR